MKMVLHLVLAGVAAWFVGCGTTANSSAAEAARPLAGTEWKLAEMDGKALAVTEGLRTPTLQLDATTRRASGTSGINRFFGGYETNGPSLKFGPLASTKMAGPRPAMVVESAFVKALAGVISWSIKGDQLELKTGDKTVLRFQAQ